jgi:hypothetical protein
MKSKKGEGGNVGIRFMRVGGSCDFSLGGGWRKGGWRPCDRYSRLGSGTG